MQIPRALCAVAGESKGQLKRRARSAFCSSREGTGCLAIYHFLDCRGDLVCSQGVLSVVGSSERSEPIGTEALGEDDFAGSGPSRR